MGRISSIFKADGEETGNAYSVSEWWLDPNTKGPGAHKNDDDHAWYVIEGAMSILIGKKWIDAPKGSFVLIPGGVSHDFENRSQKRAGILSFNSGAGFEGEMPGISKWFAENPPGDAIG
jgi:mannose-6-phosphate isomerase-like protein (cupin superfamily)